MTTVTVIPDPLEYWDGPNLYAYVGNDPINVVDPLGLSHTASLTCSQLEREAAVECRGLDPNDPDDQGRLWELCLLGMESGACTIDEHDLFEPNFVSPGAQGVIDGGLAGGRLKAQTSTSVKPDFCYSTAHQRGSAFVWFGSSVSSAGLIVGAGAVASAPFTGGVSLLVEPFAASAVAFGSAVALFGSVEQTLAGDYNAPIRALADIAGGRVAKSLVGNDLEAGLLNSVLGDLTQPLADPCN